LTTLGYIDSYLGEIDSVGDNLLLLKNLLLREKETDFISLNQLSEDLLNIDLSLYLFGPSI